MPAILVKLTETNGSTFQTLTDENGNYSFSASTIPPGTDSRVDFLNLDDNSEGIPGVQNGTITQFIKGGISAQANLALMNSNDYCIESGLKLLTPCYVNGDPLDGGSAGLDPAIVEFQFDASGVAGQNGSPYPSELAKMSQIGTAWGTVYQKRGQTFLLGSLVRRHPVLSPLGTGGIYAIDGITNNFINLIDIKTLGIDTGPDMHFGLPANKLILNEDSLIIHYVGKTGIGSLTLSEDEKTLFFINLYDKKLYSFHVGVPARSINM